MEQVLEILINGLTYAGNVFHSVINYGLISITIAPFLVRAKRQQTWQWLGCLLIGIVVQIILWFVANAVGVSVVWCTMAGYSLLDRAYGSGASDPMRRRNLTIALGFAFVGIAYYAITFPAITTIAHVIAVLMGIGVFRLFGVRTAKPRAGRTG